MAVVLRVRTKDPCTTVYIACTMSSQLAPRAVRDDGLEPPQLSAYTIELIHSSKLQGLYGMALTGNDTLKSNLEQKIKAAPKALPRSDTSSSHLTGTLHLGHSLALTPHTEASWEGLSDLGHPTKTPTKTQPAKRTRLSGSHDEHQQVKIPESAREKKARVDSLEKAWLERSEREISPELENDLFRDVSPANQSPLVTPIPDYRSFARFDRPKVLPDPKFRVPLHPVPPASLNASFKRPEFKKPEAKCERVTSTRVSVETPCESVDKKCESVDKSRESVDKVCESVNKVCEPEGKVLHINGERYEQLEQIGRGGLSEVFKVRQVLSGQLFALKKVTFDQFDDAFVDGFKQEIDLLQRLRSDPRVVRLVDHAVVATRLYLVMECGELDLARVLLSRRNSEPALDLAFVRFHASEVLKCVRAVHGANIVHSDLKPANFLFVKGVLKIIDFGIANAVPDHTVNVYRSAQIGTPNYMAPEALETQGCGRSTWRVGRPLDIWLCGCIIYQMVYGKPPYGQYLHQQRIHAITDPKVKVAYPSHGVGKVPVPQSLVALLQGCLARNPHDRWTVDECLQSDFLRPRAVSEQFVRDLLHLAVDFGQRNRDVGKDTYDKLVRTVMDQIGRLNV